MRRPEVIDGEWKVVDPGERQAVDVREVTRSLSLAVAQVLVGLALSVACLAAFKPLTHFVKGLLF